MTIPTDDIIQINSGRITGRRVVNGRDVFTVSPAFGDPFEVVRYEADSGEAVAWLKVWKAADGEELSRRVDHPDNEPWLTHMKPVITPLFTHPRATAVDVLNERCQRVMRERGKVYPRTCYVCGLTGPCVTSEAQLDAIASREGEGNG